MNKQSNQPKPEENPEIFDVKKFSWISIYGFIVGFCSRKIFETTNNYIPISDYSLFDLESITYGVIFMILAAIFTGSIAYTESKLGRFARIKFRSAETGKFKPAKRIKALLAIYYISAKRSIIFHALSAFIILVITDNFILSVMFCIASSVAWPLLTFGTGSNDAGDGETTDKILKLLELNTIQGALYTVLAVIAIFFGFLIIKNIPQTLGGARPQEAIIHMRNSLLNDSLPINRFNHKPVIPLYKQGSTIWIKGRYDSTKFAISKGDISAVENIYIKK